MLKKLFLHEARGAIRLLPLLAVINLSAAALIIGIEHAMAAFDDMDTLLPLLLSLALFLLYIVPLLTTLALPVYSYIRFYRNLFTDEGYLTFTLPVKRRAILHAKLFSTLLFGTVGTLIAGLAILLCVWLGPDDFAYLGLDLSSLFDPFTTSQLIALAVLLFASFYLHTTFVYFCITLGATILKKGKLFVGIVIYYVGNSILGGIAQAAVYLLVILLAPHFSVLAENLTEGGANAILTLVFLLASVALATIGAFFHLFTLHFIERKLNLP